jgi:immune inhibitor A
VTRDRRRCLVLLTLLVLPGAGSAQAGRGRPRPQVSRWEVPGFDFRPDGAWRRWARAVRERRALLLSEGAFTALNAPLAAGVARPAASAVAGVLKVPAILFNFKDVTVPFDTSVFNQILFAPAPVGAAAGRPYTYRSFYRELSNGLLDIQGQTYGPARLDSAEVYYAGGTSTTCQAQNPFNSTNCNGVWSGPAIARMQSGLAEALRKLDSTVDFAPFADTSGFVPLVMFLQPAAGGECGPPSAPQNHLWSHRFALPTPFVTNDPDPYHAGQFVKISDYVLEPAVGGETSCNPTQPMPIGTVAHETGHGFGLPDLYDTGGNSEGVGEYSLMGSGNFTSPFSPSRLDAWSLSTLGWVTVVPADTGGHYAFGPAPTSDTTFLVRPTGANPRGEYFLLENRQAVQADSAMIRIHCQVSGAAMPPCGGGLLVWHVDSQQVVDGAFSNTVNSGPIHGVALLQADGLGNLDANPASSASNRGDGGDPYPGLSGNTTLSSTSVPNDVLNSGVCSGVRVDSIVQAVPNSTMRFVLGLAGAEPVAITTAAALPGGLWGYFYALTLGAACGSGTYTWAVDSGAPPPGVTLSSAGALQGAPADTGSYSFRATVTSGATSARRTFTVRITEPVLTKQQVLALAFQGPQPPSDNLRSYLDLQGNKNGTFDIGDVLRWLVRTGNVPAPAPVAGARR